MFSERDINEFKYYIIQNLVSNFNITELEAKDMLKASPINDLLREDPEMVMHDGVSCWAKLIYNYKRPMEMAMN